jgi:ribosome recycling factor
MIDDIKKSAEQRMRKSVESLKEDLRRLRTGRAHTGLLEHITVEYYGTVVPVSQVATLSVEDARTITVAPWERNMVQAVERAILNSDLGLTPMTAGSVIRVPLPPMTEERRRDMVKVVRHEAEGGRVAIRNIRRDSLGDLKDMLKEKLITEDEDRRAHEEMQKLTDHYVAEVDRLLAEKEAEIMAF